MNWLEIVFTALMGVPPGGHGDPDSPFRHAQTIVGVVLLGVGAVSVVVGAWLWVLR